MKQKLFYILGMMIVPMVSFSQSGSIRKDAGVNVVLLDATGKGLNNEIVVFKSEANGIEYQGLTDSTGKFSIRLISGDTYDYFVFGFYDSTQKKTLEIPALKGTAQYSSPFEVDMQFTPPASFVLQGCNFETGKATLDEDSYTVLDELVKYLQRKQEEKVEIAGYTDNVGKADANQILSQNRANTVRAYLLTKGISPDRVTAVGYGMGNPIDDNNTAEGRAANRRIEVKTLTAD